MFGRGEGGGALADVCDDGLRELLADFGQLLERRGVAGDDLRGDLLRGLGEGAEGFAPPDAADAGEQVEECAVVEGPGIR